jgi:hypothetical protein
MKKKALAIATASHVGAAGLGIGIIWCDSSQDYTLIFYLY